MSWNRLIRFDIIFSMLCLVILFQNCAQQKGTEETVSETSSTNSEEDVVPSDLVTQFSGKMTSNFNSVGLDGKAWGYALDNNQKDKALKILFYGNGPAGNGGVYLGEATANLKGVGTYSGHYFTFKVPDSMATGVYQFLYAYAHEAKTEYQIKASPISFVSYTPKAESFFTQNINPFVQNNCTRCHTWTYSSLFYGPLLNPTSADSSNKGTAANNRLIRKLAGLESHSGGTFCSGGISSGICTTIQQWWQAEFQ